MSSTREEAPSERRQEQAVTSAVMACFYPAHPPAWGAGRVTCGLAERIGVPCTVLQCGPDDVRAEDTDRVKTIAPCSGDSLSEKLLQVPDVVRALAGEIAERAPDVLILEGASWPAYHWLLLRALDRPASEGRPLGVVYHAHNVEYDLRRERYGWLSPVVAGITSWFEEALLERVDAATAVSSADARRFQALYEKDVDVVPNAVDVDRLAQAPPPGELTGPEPPAGPSLLYSGSYEYPPNRAAIDWLVQQMPTLRQRLPETTLAVTGGAVPHQRDFLHAPGHLPEPTYRHWLQTADVAVVPLQHGSGTRLKILEAMAAGTPVVATPKGVEGIAALPGTDLLVAELGAPFLEAVVRLLEDSSLRAELSRSARETVRSRYDWSVAAQRMDEVLKHAVRREAET